MCLFALAGAGAAAGAASSIGSIASVLGSVVGAVGAIQQGQAANNVAQYNAQVAENNAAAERERAAYESGITRDRVGRVLATQQAAFSGTGLNSRRGTPVAVLGDTRREGELDVLARIYGGESAARANENDANRFRAEGRAQRQAGFIGAGSSLIRGLGSLGGTSSRRYTPLAFPQNGLFRS